MMTLDGESDIQLLQLALAGEEAAFTTFDRRWQGGIYRFAQRISNSGPIAEDVTQEVFLTLMDGASRYDPALGPFSSYIYGIARNHVLRRMNRERRFAPMMEDSHGGDETIDNHPGIFVDPLGNVVRQEIIQSLHRAIATLPLRYREVVVLCELQELDYAAAARVIGCPEGTIRSRLHRARTILLDKLRETAGEKSRTPGIEPARCLL